MKLDNHEKRWLMWGALIILFLIGLWLYMRNQAAPVVVGTPTPDDAPTQYATTPGIPDLSIIYWGQPNPASTVADLQFNVGGPAYLSTGYIPLFGLVGFGSGPGYNG
jgi:hypothetical protein